MAATFQFEEDNGAASGSPTHGTATTARTEINWKNIDDSTTAYSAQPIVAGNNSFEKWQYGNFSGTFDQVSAGLWAHTATAFGAGLTLMGIAPVTSTATAAVYTTPSVTTNSTLTTNMTTAIAIASGTAVWFTATGPQVAVTGGASSMTTNPCFTTYLTTQLQTTTSAAAGDTATVTLTLQYNEN